MKRAFVCVGLMYGDEGKGLCTASLCQRFKADLVIRYSGGAQCGHNVEMEDDRHHEFHMFGSGTFMNIPTLFTKDAVIDLTVVKAEAQKLESKGVNDPLKLLYFTHDSLVTTPFHRALNRLKEMSRTKRHGSCGFGLGDTVSYSLDHPDSAIHISDVDLYKPKVLKLKLALIRDYCLKEANKLTLDFSKFSLPAMNEYAILKTDKSFIGFLAERYREILLSANVIYNTDIADFINEKNLIVFEGAQGILLDQDYGTFPYNTWTTTTSKNALEFLNQVKWSGKTEVIGVTRVYATRHGAGPFVTEDPYLKLIDKYNKTNQYQQNFRNGYLDLVALKYACEIDGHIDSLAVTHIDKLWVTEKDWKVCVEYPEFELLRPLESTLEAQAIQSDLLYSVKPSYVHFKPYEIPSLISRALSKPIRIYSHCPVAGKQTMFNNFEESFGNNRPTAVSAVV